MHVCPAPRRIQVLLHAPTHRQREKLDVAVIRCRKDQDTAGFHRRADARQLVCRRKAVGNHLDAGDKIEGAPSAQAARDVPSAGDLRQLKISGASQATGQNLQEHARCIAEGDQFTVCWLRNQWACSVARPALRPGVRVQSQAAVAVNGQPRRRVNSPVHCVAHACCSPVRGATLCAPGDLHAPLLMLCSDAALGITGTVITVDDGQTL